MEILFDTLIIGQDFPVLKKNDIHLWRVSLDPSEEILKGAKSALSDFELSRLDFFEFERVQRNYTMSQGVLRILIANYLSIDIKEVELGRRSKGKPFCKNDESLFFNISNSGGLCVFAFSRDNEVGLDLEKIRPLNDLEEMINKNFSNQEQSYIRRTKDETLRRFYFYWTIKESYLKAIGEGMRIEPQNLEFSIQNDRIRLLGVNGYTDYDDWVFEETPFSPEYVRTLTYIGEGIDITNFAIISDAAFGGV
ncbi:MAG: 4'-phosphopantetheinyl transferase superfamily protein [Crocinitomicaceae bacterium]|nr:4'-phosphopantetheinyl transferase superfamily protein [Crocinitomicaceae bacterium]